MGREFFESSTVVLPWGLLLMLFTVWACLFYFISNLQDVTESKRHDRAVAAMANELRQLVDTANAPIFGIDVFGNVNEWNDKTAEITGFSKEEAFNKPLVSTFIMPKLRRSIQEVMDSALRGDETSNYELEFCTKSDEIRYLLVNATTRRDEDSNIVGVVGVAQDVTESKRHDRAVAAMANELRQLVDTANAPIFGIGELGSDQVLVACIA